MRKSAQNNSSNGRPDVALESILHGELNVALQGAPQSLLFSATEDAKGDKKNAFDVAFDGALEDSFASAIEDTTEGLSEGTPKGVP